MELRDAPKIVLSYRREDTQAATHMLFERLIKRFGREAIFLDFDSIALGYDFRDHIRTEFQKCNVVLAIIGPNWRGPKGRGRNRLNDPEDWVRIEIETALESGIRTIPILIDSAQMPVADQLPVSIRKLAYMQAVRVDTGIDFEVHTDRLLKAIDKFLTSDSSNEKGPLHLNNDVMSQEGGNQNQIQREANTATISEGQRGRSINLVEIFTALIVAALLIMALQQMLPLLSKKLGTELTSLIMFVSAACLAFSLIMFRRYSAILSAGGSPARSPERRDYDALRDSLADGGSPARIYAQWLEKALHAVERFFGDAGLADQSLFPRAFGLAKSVPVWTAPALYRCILLALIYPLGTIFLVWVISGRVGAAETAVALPPNLAAWSRYTVLAALTIGSVCYWQAYKLLKSWQGRIKNAQSQKKRNEQRPSTKSRYWLVILLCSLIVAVISSDVVNNLLIGSAFGRISGSTGLTSSVVGAVAGDAAIAITSALGAVIVGAMSLSMIDAHAGTIAAAIAGGTIGLVAGATGIEDYASSRIGRSGLLLVTFLIITIIACITSPYVLSSSDKWPLAGPLILFVGLLSALNAPFDWFSLGLTRALLWLGLERKGWWPYFYAMLDAALAVLVIGILAVVMVIGVQTLDLVAVAAGGSPVLPLVTRAGTNGMPLLEGIAVNPAAPEFWWVYALLLSTMIPSLVNLTIGGLSLTRGIPALSRYLYIRLPATEPVAPYDRNFIALILMFQWIAGIGLGVLAQVALIWGIFGHLLPSLGIDMLDLARSIAVFDLPGHVFRLL